MIRARTTVNNMASPFLFPVKVKTKSSLLLRIQAKVVVSALWIHDSHAVNRVHKLNGPPAHSLRWGDALRSIFLRLRNRRQYWFWGWCLGQVGFQLLPQKTGVPLQNLSWEGGCWMPTIREGPVCWEGAWESYSGPREECFSSSVCGCSLWKQPHPKPNCVILCCLKVYTSGK